MNLKGVMKRILDFRALLFAHETGIDIEKAILEKIKLNDQKYPVEKSKGTSKKYRELD